MRESRYSKLVGAYIFQSEIPVTFRKWSSENLLWLATAPTHARVMKLLARPKSRGSQSTLCSVSITKQVEMHRVDRQQCPYLSTCSPGLGKATP